MLAVMAATVVLLLGLSSSVSANESTITPASNPALPQTCGLDLAVTLDYSTSMSAAQLDQQVDEVKAMATALEGYPVSLALFNFGTESPLPGNSALPLTSLETAAGVQAVHDHLDSFSRSGTQFTNWEAAFEAVRTSGETFDALLFVTDGNPTITNDRLPSNYDTGYQNASPVPQDIVDDSVAAANALKATGARIIGIGLDDNINEFEEAAMYRQLPQVSGPVEGDDFFIGGLASLQAMLVNDVVNPSCASIGLVKEGELGDGEYGEAGDTITYTFTITNTGDVPLTDVALTDPLPGLSAITFGAWPGPEGELQPTEQVTATATYEVTPDDAEAGSVFNTATASGLPPAGDRVEDEDPETVELSTPPPPSTTTTTEPPGTTSTTTSTTEPPTTTTEDTEVGGIDTVPDEGGVGGSEASPTQLPMTGSSPIGLILVALMFVATGTLLVFQRRRMLAPEATHRS